jgi:hypothetical protein
MPHVDFPQTFCRVGVGRRDITPPVGIYHRMWGAATHDRSTGVHRPLVATALAFSPSGEGGPTAPTCVIASVDHCLLWNEEMEIVRVTAARDAGLEPEELHIAFSHTHAAGLMDPARADLPGGELIAEYLDLLARRIGEAADEAVLTMREARIVYGHGRCDLAQHRDFWDEASGQFVCGFNPTGPRDDTVLVARVADEESKPIATLVNYACHPTTLAWENTLISPDYVGAMRDLIEQATQAPCLFLQGASGDLGPRHGYVGDVEVADRNGRELGHAALAAIEPLPAAGVRFEYAGPVVSGATLGAWEYRPLPAELVREKHSWRRHDFKVDLALRAGLPNRDQTQAQLDHWSKEERAAIEQKDEARARDCRAQAERMTRQLSRLRGLPPGDALTVPVTICQWGDAFWVLLPGEYYNLLQRRLRERFPNRAVIVSTVTNGWVPGYVPTAETYGKRIYQESIALVAAGSLEVLIERIGSELGALGAN